MRMSASPDPIRMVYGYSNNKPFSASSGFIRSKLLTLIAVTASILLVAFPAISALQDNTTASDVSADKDNSRSIAVGDLNGDTFPDIVVANEDGERNRIYFGDGAGNFGAGIDLGNREEDTDSVSLADVDQDNDLDIVIGNRSTNEANRLYLNDGSGNFTARDTAIDDAMYTRATSTVRFADVNNDGDPDIMVANRNSSNRVFYGNPAAGVSGFPSNEILPDSGLSDSSSLAAGRITVDNCPDVVVANRRNLRNDLYVNSANCSTFNIRRDLSPDTNYTDWIEIADLNNDGINDVITANRYQPNLYLLGTGSANLDNLFAPSVQISSDADYTRDIRAIDIDGDGDLDIITANNSQSPNKIYLNQFIETGLVGFGDAIALTSDMTESIAIAVCATTPDPNDIDCDLDGDGDVDLIFANNGVNGEGAINRAYANNNEDPAFFSTPITGATDGELYSYLAEAFDPDQGQTLTITGTVPAWLVLTDNGNGTATVEGTPANGDVGGTHAVALTVSDGTLTDTQNFNIAVDGSNAAPSITSTAPTSVEQGNTGNNSYVYDITTSDADHNADTLAISATILPSWMSIVDNGDGTAALTSNLDRPDQGDIGDHSVVVRVTDPLGRTGEETFVVSVTDGNDRPDARPDDIQMVIGGTVTQLGPGEPEYDSTSVLWNDFDPDGDSLTVAAVTIAPVNGAVTLNPDGTFSYTHDGSPAQGNGTLDSFRYRITDGNGANDQATVTISVFGGNSPPTAVNDAYTAPNGGAVPGAPNVLANDTDANGDILTAELDTGPANAAAFTLNADGTFTYTHDGSATIADSFTYRARDTANAISNVATVALTIDAPVDTTPPVITLTGAAGINVTIGNPYTDSGATATDETDGDLTASIVTNNPVNTATLGAYVVTYDVSDAAGNPAIQVTRTVTVVSAPVVPPPPSGGGGGSAALLELLGLMFLVVTSRRRLRVTRRSI